MLMGHGSTLLACMQDPLAVLQQPSERTGGRCPKPQSHTLGDPPGSPLSHSYSQNDHGPIRHSSVQRNRIGSAGAGHASDSRFPSALTALVFESGAMRQEARAQGPMVPSIGSCHASSRADLASASVVPVQWCVLVSILC
jgi:hypothetical protein